MNRNGEKPESLKTEPDAVATEFVSAVGDDSITRFDDTRKKKKRRPARQGKGGGSGNGRQQRGQKPQKQESNS